MPKPLVPLDEFISFIVMLLLTVALIAGQADATDRQASPTRAAISKALVEGEIAATALKVSIDVAADLRQRRGEDD